MPLTMTGALRDFWFPLLLAFLGVIPLFLAGSATGNGRKVMLTITALFLFLAVLSYVWGDPVRGPFANLIHPHNVQEFAFVVGSNSMIFPVSQLKDGIDFSNGFYIGDYLPMQLWVRKTWWSGLYVKTTLKNSDGTTMLVFDNRKILLNDSHFDVNYDDYAFELVAPTKAPVFQLVISKDYSSIHVNARLNKNGLVYILKDDGTYSETPEVAKQPQFNLDRIFKYPSNLYQGERN